MHHPKMTLLVKERVSAGKDRLGNEVFTYTEPIPVSGCLFAPGQPKDLVIERPEGVEIRATAYFPKGWATKLRKAQVSPDGKVWLTVIGEPFEYPSQMLPAKWPWHCMVPLGATDG